MSVLKSEVKKRQLLFPGDRYTEGNLILNEVIEDVISYDELILEQSGSLIQYHWCRYKKGEIGHRRRHAWKEDDVKTLREDGH